MTNRVVVGNLRVAQNLYDFITNEAIPGTGINPESFWAGVDKVVTDLAGRNTGSGQGRGGGPMADVHNLELEMKRRSLRQLVSHIETLAQANPGDGCWLAAPKEIMHQVLESLAPPVRGRIEKSVPRDLTKTEPKELLEYFLPDHMTSR